MLLRDKVCKVLIPLVIWNAIKTGNSTELWEQMWVLGASPALGMETAAVSWGLCHTIIIFSAFIFECLHLEISQSHIWIKETYSWWQCAGTYNVQVHTSMRDKLHTKHLRNYYLKQPSSFSLFFLKKVFYFKNI